ncbi:MAG TPA: efflux transporter outer membrane subunit [Phycisphaerales bacterium]|nr:efflux transporter outer membrane subunit [Phycisphaerales bacterium]
MHSRDAIIASLIAAALSTGCKTDSPPTAADIRQQAGTLATMDLTTPWRAGPPTSASLGPIADNWLATFDDAQLSALVAEAMANNPDLRVTATRVEIAAQYVELARAQMRPAVNLFGTGGLNMGGGDVSSALQGLSLGVSWEPDLWARMRYGRNAAQSTFASAQADFEFGRQSLAATIAKGWFTASETALQLRIAEGMLESAQELMTLAETRRRVGPGREDDVVLARANLGTFQDETKQLQLAHEQALRALELLVGRYPAAELATRSDLVALPGPIPTGLPIEMLERRPDMIAAERRVAAAFNRVGEAKAARLPRIILNANLAVISSDVVELKDDFKNPTAGIGAKIIAPIYDGGALKTQVVIRTLEQKEAIAEYARIALQALGDVENALAASQSLAERESMLRQVLTDHERVLELSKTNYRIGSGDMRAVQQQQVEVNSAHLALLRVQSEQLAQRVNLHLALGGSFETGPGAVTPAPPDTQPASQPASQPATQPAVIMKPS